jgi:hypothetical protein
LQFPLRAPLQCIDADVVHVIWDIESEDCLFDLDVAFALGKRIISLDLPAGPPAEKSNKNVRASD